VLAGVFVTAFYSFRMYFLVFHGKERFDQNAAARARSASDAEPDPHGHQPGAPACRTSRRGS
jgi:NADH-quinone oxidoreductase subunit L